MDNNQIELLKKTRHLYKEKSKKYFDKFTTEKYHTRCRLPNQVFL